MDSHAKFIYPALSGETGLPHIQQFLGTIGRHNQNTEAVPTRSQYGIVSTRAKFREPIHAPLSLQWHSNLPIARIPAAQF
jgi:hypothetical protein